jgi:hypothetical protein
MIDSGRSPIRQRRCGYSTLELDFHASGFVTRVEGAWTDADLAQFRHFLALRQFRPTEEELLSSLQRAKRKYLEGQHRLFLCGDHPCCKARDFETSESALAAASRAAEVPISITGCQGQCKHAPIASLRIGDQSQMVAQVANSDDWLAVLSFAKSAVQADSLLINPGNAAAYLHDPFHEHPRTDVHSKALQFLIGRFRGEGHCGSGGYTFQKEVVGTFEAGSRFVALRMAATYPSTDGRKDTHRALVIVGPKPSSGNIIGRAYTDGGAICEYEVKQEGEVLSFADAPPDHTREWKHSRKLIKPTNEGFEERLVVDAGEGFFTYYSIPMRRIAVV